MAQNTQYANVLTDYTQAVDKLLTALAEAGIRRQQAIDIGLVSDLGNIDFSEYGELAYLTEDKVLDASGFVSDLTDVLDANGRAGWAALFLVTP